MELESWHFEPQASSSSKIPKTETMTESPIPVLNRNNEKSPKNLETKPELQKLPENRNKHEP